MKNIKEEIYLALEKLDIETDCEVSRFLNKNGYPNLTCCPNCHVDDFVHVEGCKFSENEISVVDKINLTNEEKYGKIKECCHMYPPFCRCEKL